MQNSSSTSSSASSSASSSLPDDVKPIVRPLRVDDLTHLARLSRERAQHHALFDAAYRLADEVIGCRLFTIMRFDAESFEVERLFSNRPDLYPPSGRKKKRGSAWGEQVLTRYTPFLGRDREAMRANFDDHETLFAMGLGSILNIPVAFDGRCVGTMNLTHEEGWYDERHIAVGLTIAAFLAAPLCCAPTQG